MMNAKEKAALGSIAASAGLTAAKGIVGLLTGSLAIPWPIANQIKARARIEALSSCKLGNGAVAHHPLRGRKRESCRGPSA